MVHELTVDALDELIDELESEADVLRAALTLSADADGLARRHRAMLRLLPTPVAQDLTGLDEQQLGAAVRLAASIDGRR